MPGPKRERINEVNRRVEDIAHWIYDPRNIAWTCTCLAPKTGCPGCFKRVELLREVKDLYDVIAWKEQIKPKEDPV